MNAKLLPAVLLLAAVLLPARARAHCDTLDGPVVIAARAALESGKLEPVLAWVQAGDEREIRDAFARARAVRKGTREARELADTWFFETLVRVHRAGEGAPYTGLKPGGTPDPVIAAADRVAAGGDAHALEERLVGTVREGLHRHVATLRAEKPPAGDVAAGRRWVAAYVPFVHWAEGVEAAAARGGGHGHAAAAHGDAARGGHEAGHAEQGHAAPAHGDGHAGHDAAPHAAGEAAAKPHAHGH